MMTAAAVPLLDRDGYHDLPPGKIAAVVTFLEMTESPPVKPAAPDRPDLTLRRVERPDAGWYRDLYRRIGQDWLWFSRLVMPEAELLAVIRGPAVEVWALTRGGGDVGLLEFDRRDPSDVELAYFGLVPELVGQGAGRWLMGKALELAWAPGTRRVWLHTCTLDHPDALRFYARSGFRPFRRAVEVADDPRLTGDCPRDVAPRLPLIG